MMGAWNMMSLIPPGSADPQEQEKVLRRLREDLDDLRRFATGTGEDFPTPVEPDTASG